MPLLIVKPEEIRARLNRDTTIPDIIKDYAVKENSFRVQLKIEKIPVDIMINLTFDSYANGVIYFSYSGNIPKVFLSLLKGIIKDRTKGVITIEDEFILLHVYEVLPESMAQIRIKHITFEQGFYKIDFDL